MQFSTRVFTWPLWVPYALLGATNQPPDMPGQRKAKLCVQPNLGTEVAQQEEQQRVWAGSLSHFPAWALCLSKENGR